MNVKKIRAVCAASTSRLQEVAEKHKLPVEQVKALRLQYRRLLEGRCVVCGTHSKGDKCPSCRHHARGKTVIELNVNQLLGRMSGWSVVARETCTECQKPFLVRARDVLAIIRQEGASKLPTRCPECRSRPKAEKAPKVPKKTCLTYRPFEALKTAQNAKNRVIPGDKKSETRTALNQRS